MAHFKQKPNGQADLVDNNGKSLGLFSQFVNVEVTSAELLALFATPKALVPAPGVGKALILDMVVLYKPAGTAYAGIAAGEDLSVKYTNAAGVEAAQIEATGFLDQATAQTRVARAAAAAALVPVENAALVLHMLTGEIITGNTVLKLRVFYRVVPFTL